MVKQKVGTILLQFIATTCATHAQLDQNLVQNAIKCSEFEKSEGIEDFWSLVREFEKEEATCDLDIGQHKILTIKTTSYDLECVNIRYFKDPHHDLHECISCYKLSSNGKMYLLKRARHKFGYMSDVGVYDKKIEHKGIAKIFNACIIFTYRTKQVDDKEYEKRNEKTVETSDSSSDSIELETLTGEEELDEKRKLAEREQTARTLASANSAETKKMYQWYAEKYSWSIYYALIEYLPLCFVELSKDEWNNAGVNVIEAEYMHGRSIDAILKMGLDIAQAIEFLHKKGLLHLDVCLDNIRGCTNKEGDWEFKLFSHNLIAEMLHEGMTPSKICKRDYKSPKNNVKRYNIRHFDAYCLGRVLYYCQEDYERLCTKKTEEDHVFQDPKKLDIFKTVICKIYEERPRINEIIEILQAALEEVKKLNKE